MRALVWFAALVSGCGGTSPASTTDAAGDASTTPSISVRYDGVPICVGAPVTITDQVGQNRIDLVAGACFDAIFFEMVDGNTLPCTSLRVAAGGCGRGFVPEGTATRRGTTVDATCTCHYEDSLPTPPVPHVIELEVRAGVLQPGSS